MSQTLYIVSGMHRSGTSAIVHLLEVFGISLPGELVGPADDNQKGFFEDNAIIELNNELLEKLRLRWDSLDGFFLEDQDFSHPRFNQLKKRARDLLTARTEPGIDWAFKDPRLCRLMGFWLPLVEGLGIAHKLVIALRQPAEVAASLATRNGFDHLKSNYLWFLHNLALLDATQGSPRTCVNYETLMHAPERVIDELSSFLPPVAEERKNLFLDAFLSPDLHHNTGLDADGSLELADDLYLQMKSGGFTEDSIRALRQQLATRQDLIDLMSLLSRQEIEQARQLQEEYESLTAVIAKKDENILAFKDYQLKLETDLQTEKNWSQKLSEDIESTQADLANLEAAKASLDSRVESLQQNIEEEKVAAKKESHRLWEIIENYRREVHAIETSHSWRLTAPARWLRRVIQESPSRAFQASRQVVRDAISSLPPDSMLRQRLLLSAERTRAFMRGDIDNYSIRESNRWLINDRGQLLGEKPLLVDEELPVLDISIVTYNSARWVKAFYESLCAQDYPLSKLNLVFVDNGSTDDTIAQLNQLYWSAFATMQCLKNDNVGFGGGHNHGITTGAAALVLVTNVDLEFRRDSLRQAVSFAMADESNVACWELRQSPFEHPKFYDPVTLQTAWSAHACILIRREVFELSGGYERRIFMYGEDVELSYRFRTLGYKLRYLPMAQVDHYSYEEAGEIKLLQYQGSTLANAYLRLRYGSLVDVLKVLPMNLRLLIGSGGVPEHRRLIWQNLGKIFLNAWYFLGRRLDTGGFSFHGWDYEIVRIGAFYEAKPLPEECPLITVITRTYHGRETLLQQCMQSVANQTYKNVEHLIIEDGGDSMSQTIQRFRQAYSAARVRHLPLEKVGRCHAGNSGLEAAWGKYLVFLDDDDLFFADHLEVCVAELEADDEVSAVYALAWEVETEFDGDTYEERSHGTPPILRQAFDRDTLYHHNYIPIQAIVFDRSLFEEHGGFDPELENLEDWNLWVRFASTASFKLIEKTTSMYRTPWSITEKSRRQAILDDYLETAMAKNASHQL